MWFPPVRLSFAISPAGICVILTILHARARMRSRRFESPPRRVVPLFGEFVLRVKLNDRSIYKVLSIYPSVSLSRSLANIRRRLLCRAIERCSEWVSSDSACPEKTNCESGSGSQSSGDGGRRDRERPLDPEGDNAGSRRPVRLGLLRVFECVDDPASLPIVGENRKVSDTPRALLDDVPLNG